jgi:uncharacterized protein YcaQ
MIKYISLAEARLLNLRSQWLQPHFPLHGKDDTLKTIEHLGYIQIDTLSVVERAHHHTLWSRISDYKKSWLHELFEEMHLFEYWSHAASYLPMKDFRFSLLRKSAYINGKSHWFEQDKKVKRFVLNRIKREGPLQSKDFEADDDKKGTWYYWKPAKRALEQLFMEGKLMVSHRQGFQKVYDLSENVLPSGINIKPPTKNEYAEHLIATAIRSNGIVTENEICYQRPGSAEIVRKAIRNMLKDGRIMALKLEGNQEKNFYGDEQCLNELNAASIHPSLHILSPFDNLLIQRKRIQRLFGFDYVIECYLPEHKRKFGYFTLPILYGDCFIARIDPKADRLNKKFYIRNLAFEEKFTGEEQALVLFCEKLKAFAVFNGCNKIIIEKGNSKKFQDQLKKIMK